MWHHLLWGWEHNPHSLYPVSNISFKRKARLASHRLRHWGVVTLTPYQYRALLHQLVEKANEAVWGNASAAYCTRLEDGPIADPRRRSPAPWLSTPDGSPPYIEDDPLYIEIIAYACHKQQAWEDRWAKRRHRGVVCAGCGIKYGKKRKDHNFVARDGFKHSGGWSCRLELDTGLDECRVKAEGDHFCGMCAREQAAGRTVCSRGLLVAALIDASTRNGHLVCAPCVPQVTTGRARQGSRWRRTLRPQVTGRFRRRASEQR